MRTLTPTCVPACPSPSRCDVRSTAPLRPSSAMEPTSIAPSVTVPSAAHIDTRQTPARAVSCTWEARASRGLYDLLDVVNDKVAHRRRGVAGRPHQLRHHIFDTARIGRPRHSPSHFALLRARRWPYRPRQRGGPLHATHHDTQVPVRPQRPFVKPAPCYGAKGRRRSAQPTTPQRSSATPPPPSNTHPPHRLILSPPAESVTSTR